MAKEKIDYVILESSEGQLNYTETRWLFLKGKKGKLEWILPIKVQDNADEF